MSNGDRDPNEGVRILWRTIVNLAVAVTCLLIAALLLRWIFG